MWPETRTVLEALALAAATALPGTASLTLAPFWKESFRVGIAKDFRAAACADSRDGAARAGAASSRAVIAERRFFISGL